MKKEKTGREVLGSRLFAGQHSLTRYLQALPGDAEAFLRAVHEEIPTLEADELRRMLHANYELRALEIDDLLSIRIEVIERNYYNEYNTLQPGYLHEAVVPYSGSSVFWKALPHPKFEFGFPGKIGQKAASIRGLLDGPDFEWFRDKVQQNLTAARKAWNVRAGEVVILGMHARDTLDRVADAVIGKLGKDALDV